MKVEFIVQNIKVHAASEENPFLYSLSDAEDSNLSTFDVRDLHNWGWDPKTKLGMSRSLHSDVITEALFHGHLNDFLKKNNLQFRTK